MKKKKKEKKLWVKFAPSTKKIPNLLLQKHIFPELLQSDLTPDSIVTNYLKILSDPKKYQCFGSEINDAMSGEGFEIAARTIKNLL